MKEFKGANVTKEEFFNNYSIVVSRYLIMNNTAIEDTSVDHWYLILPFVDFLNHSFEPNIILNLGSKTQKFDDDGKPIPEATVDAVALRDIDIGE